MWENSNPDVSTGLRYRSTVGVVDRDAVRSIGESASILNVTGIVGNCTRGRDPFERGEHCNTHFNVTLRTRGECLVIPCAACCAACLGAVLLRGEVLSRRSCAEIGLCLPSVELNRIRSSGKSGRIHQPPALCITAFQLARYPTPQHACQHRISCPEKKKTKLARAQR